MTTTPWINPEAMEPVSKAADSHAFDAGRQLGRRLRLGLLDNTKDNAHRLLALIGERVQQDFEAELLVRRKGNATLGAPPDLLEDLAQDADCVLTAMAD